MRLKRLERACRGAFIRGMSALMGRPRRSEQPKWDARPHRVLYLRYDRIGDMILASSLIRAIATSHASLTVDVLASPWNAPVLEGNPYVGSVVLFERRKPWTYWRTIRQLRRARYDAIIDCMVTAPSTTTLIVMLLSGARHRIGAGGQSNDFAYTIAVPNLTAATHYVERTAALALPFGVDLDATDWSPAIYLSDSERAGGELAWRSHGALRDTGAPRRRLLVNISAGKPSCAWPDDKFIAVLRALRSRRDGLCTLLIGSPAESDRVAHIAREAEVSVARTPGIRSALALVAAADLVVTPDTSIVHAASSFHIPAVVLFPRRTNELYGLYRSPGERVISPGKTVAELAVAPVLAALERMLESGATASATARQG
ncbi:MAG TPA: glycosyltransferase family 9 protein [Gemmatimonadaceae bacterium]|nr:glycosyltransferase family 9 protein [Gemmatimonadaceae bacterium]